MEIREARCQYDHQWITGRSGGHYAGTAYVSPASAVLIGGIAGVLVVLAVEFFDRIKADDPVGAIAVHGVCGTFGTLAVGIFAENGGFIYSGSFNLLRIQAVGVMAVSVWAFAVTMAVFYVLKKTVGIRVSQEDELEGMDLCEHGIAAYAGIEASHSRSFSKVSEGQSKLNLGDRNMHAE